MSPAPNISLDWTPPDAKSAMRKAMHEGASQLQRARTVRGGSGSKRPWGRRRRLLKGACLWG